MFAFAITLMTISLVLAESSSMAAAYIICLIVGGGLLFISTIFGGHSHADVDADVGADFDVGVEPHVDFDVGVEPHVDFDAGADADVDFHVDTDAHVDVGADTGGDLEHHVDAHHAAHGWASVASWLSLRFLIYFAAVFGMVGTVLTYMSELSPNMVAAWAVVSGLVVGQGVHHLFRALQRSDRDTSPSTRDYVNKVARVTVAIIPPRRGEVAIRVRGTERFVPAVARNERDRFDTGDRVVVVSFEAGTAEVVSQEEFEFVTDSKPGESDDDDNDRAG